MQRLAYTPKAYVFIKNSYGQILDVSRYVVSGDINRRLDAVSSAQVVLRNPKMIFTTPDKNHRVSFSPMDPITIYLKRLRGRPVRVFTGFLDQAPYLQLYPGVLELRASCTLKRLLYTFFDPALPYTQSFFIAYGWQPNANGTWFSADALNDWKRHAADDLANTQTKDTTVDGSISNLLFATLRYIGHWASDDILIERLPTDLFARLTTMAHQFEQDNEEAAKEFEELLRRIIGEGDLGTSPAGTVDVSGVSGEVPEQVYKVGRALSVPYKHLLAAMETGLVESPIGNGKTFGNPSQANSDQGTAASGASAGWRQETANNYPGVDRNNVPESAKRFYTECKQLDTGQTAGELAADVQRPAVQYRGRYEQHRADAVTLLRQLKAKVEQDDNDAGATPGQATDPTRTIQAGSSSTKTASSGKIIAPIGPPQGTFGRGWHESSKGVTGQTDTSGSVHWHSGIDYGVPAGTPCFAPADGVITMSTLNWSDGGMIHFKFTSDVGNIKAGTIIGWGHVQKVYKQAGQKVTAGEHIADSGNPGGGPHVHFILRTDGTDGGGDGNADPVPLLTALQKGETATVDSATAASSGSSAGASNSANQGAAGAFFATLQLPSLEESIEASALGGEKSLMNDKPLMPFIQQLTEASLRHFQSMPDGKFFAFYPDYFGEMNQRPPYWEIDDIEVMDGKINLTDDTLITHEYVVGDTMNPMGSTETPLFLRSVLSSGVVTVFNAFMSDQILNRTDTNQTSSGKGPAPIGKDSPRGLNILLSRDEAVSFLQRYGARPNVEDMPMIKHPFFEMFLAYQRFMLAWSRQFSTPFTFTFMPELYPGGKVGFPDHGLQMFIEEVTHSFDYTSGFTTQAKLSAPSIYGDNIRNLPPNMVKAIIEPIVSTK